MAKRKRASLKDKGPDSLGLTQKKGKGIDLLFGGPLEEEESAASQPESEAEEEATTSPVAVDAASSEALVDELGLPVAMEAPPDDLVLAATPEEAATDEANVDVVDPSTSPFAMPPTETDSTITSPEPTDLSGIMEEENLLDGGEEPTLSSPKDEEKDVISPEEDVTLADQETAETDLSGIMEAPAAGEAPTAEAPADTIPEPEMPPAPAPSSTEQPAAPPPPPAAPPPPAPEAVPAAGSAPVFPTVAGEPPPSTRASVRPTEIGSISGIAAEPTAVSERDILPEDTRYETEGHAIALKKREQVEQDKEIAERVMRYIGPERRRKLDEQIEDLYDRVAIELSDNKEDAAFALNTLSEAQDIIFEDARQYDEALYRVAVVRTMLVRKENLRRWSYSWGMFVFFYAVIWFVLFIAGIEFVDLSQGTSDMTGAAALRSAWLSALAGGIGGVVAILYSLSWRVAYKQEFDRQYMMKYLVQPVMGFVLGAVMYFITSAGFLIFGGNASTDTVFGGVQVIDLQILLGWIAGFRQRVVYYLIDKIVQKLSPEADESKKPTSVVPDEDLYQFQRERQNEAS